MIEPKPEDASTAFVNEELEFQQGENMAAHTETQTEGLIIFTGKYTNIKRLIGALKLKQRHLIICTGKLAIIKHLTGTLKPRQKSLTITCQRVADMKPQTGVFSNQMIGSDFT